MWLKCTLLLYTIQLAKGEDIFQSDEARLAKKLLTNYNKEVSMYSSVAVPNELMNQLSVSPSLFV